MWREMRRQPGTGQASLDHAADVRGGTIADMELVNLYCWIGAYGESGGGE
jgi:hypothetical protein